MICFLDLDGVLIDFTGGAHKFHGFPYSMKDYPYELGVWENCPPPNSSMSNTKFWDALDEDFWANLEWMEDGRDLLSMMEIVFGQENICILTSTTLSHVCSSGKVRWIQQNLPEYERQFLLGPPKSFCAHDKAVLVDDRDKNIIDFMNCGGYGVLVPRAWNSKHPYRDHSISSVMQDLEYLKESDIWKD